MRITIQVVFARGLLAFVIARNLIAYVIVRNLIAYVIARSHLAYVIVRNHLAYVIARSPKATWQSPYHLLASNLSMPDSLIISADLSFAGSRI